MADHRASGLPPAAKPATQKPKIEHHTPKFLKPDVKRAQLDINQPDVYVSLQKRQSDMASIIWAVPGYSQHKPQHAGTVVCVHVQS